MSNQQHKNEEEVDLGSLFKIIGKGFSNFFNFIGDIFKGTFHFLILCLLFLRKHALKIGVVTVLGGVLGAFFHFTKPQKYGSEMLLEPNFKSARQLYNNIQFYSDLVEQKDTAKLQSVFNLTKEEAGSLKKFEIQPISVENDIISAYNSLILSVDTLTIKSYSYEEFKASFTDYDYKIHRLLVEAEKNYVFDKLDETIIESVESNKYYNRFKELLNENINKADSTYKDNLKKLDSLRIVYMKSMIEESKKETSGTSIRFGGENQKIKELEVFETYRKINSDLRNLALEKSNKYEVINVISNFQPIGYEIKGLTKNYISLFSFIGFFGMIIILLLIELNTYLNNYEK